MTTQPEIKDLPVTGFKEKVSEMLYQFQQEDYMCDAIIFGSDGSVPAHKIILMASSEFFREKIIFKENYFCESMFYLHEYSVVDIENIIRLFYTGRLMFDRQRIESFIRLCKELKLDDMVKVCEGISAKNRLKTSEQSHVDHVSKKQNEDLYDNISDISSVTSDSEDSVNIRNQGMNDSSLIYKSAKSLSLLYGLSTKNTLEHQLKDTFSESKKKANTETPPTSKQYLGIGSTDKSFETMANDSSQKESVNELSGVLQLKNTNVTLNESSGIHITPRKDTSGLLTVKSKEVISSPSKKSFIESTKDSGILQDYGSTNPPQVKKKITLSDSSDLEYSPRHHETQEKHDLTEQYNPPSPLRLKYRSITLEKTEKVKAMFKCKCCNVNFPSKKALFQHRVTSSCRKSSFMNGKQGFYKKKKNKKKMLNEALVKNGKSSKNGSPEVSRESIEFKKPFVSVKGINQKRHVSEKIEENFVKDINFTFQNKNNTSNLTKGVSGIHEDLVTKNFVEIPKKLQRVNEANFKEGNMKANHGEQIIEGNHDSDYNSNTRISSAGISSNIENKISSGTKRKASLDSETPATVSKKTNSDMEMEKSNQEITTEKILKQSIPTTELKMKPEVLSRESSELEKNLTAATEMLKACSDTDNMFEKSRQKHKEQTPVTETLNNTMQENIKTTTQHTVSKGNKQDKGARSPEKQPKDKSPKSEKHRSKSKLIVKLNKMTVKTSKEISKKPSKLLNRAMYKVTPSQEKLHEEPNVLTEKQDETLRSSEDLQIGNIASDKLINNNVSQDNERPSIDQKTGDKMETRKTKASVADDRPVTVSCPNLTDENLDATRDKESFKHSLNTQEEGEYQIETRKTNKRLSDSEEKNTKNSSRHSTDESLDVDKEKQSKKNAQSIETEDETRMETRKTNKRLSEAEVNATKNSDLHSPAAGDGVIVGKDKQSEEKTRKEDETRMESTKTIKKVSEENATKSSNYCSTGDGTIVSKDKQSDKKTRKEDETRMESRKTNKRLYDSEEKRIKRTHRTLTEEGTTVTKDCKLHPNAQVNRKDVKFKSESKKSVKHVSESEENEHLDKDSVDGESKSTKNIKHIDESRMETRKTNRRHSESEENTIENTNRSTVDGDISVNKINEGIENVKITKKLEEFKMETRKKSKHLSESEERPIQNVENISKQQKRSPVKDKRKSSDKEDTSPSRNLRKDAVDTDVPNEKQNSRKESRHTTRTTFEDAIGMIYDYRSFKKRKNDRKRDQSSRLKLQNILFKHRLSDPTYGSGRGDSTLDGREVKSPEKRHDCSFCKKSYKSSAELLSHKTVHTASNIYTCKFCSKLFDDKNTFQDHVIKHAKKGSYFCGICNKVYRKLGSLRLHFKVECGKETHRCDKCGKEFALKENLLAHQVIHADEMSLRCKICKKQFRTILVLRMHMKLHREKHECKLCGKQFNSADFLVQHEKHHECDKGDNKFKCDMCDSSFSEQTKLEKHVTEHKEQRTGHFDSVKNDAEKSPKKNTEKLPKIVKANHSEDGNEKLEVSKQNDIEHKKDILDKPRTSRLEQNVVQRGSKDSDKRSEKEVMDTTYNENFNKDGIGKESILPIDGFDTSKTYHKLRSGKDEINTKLISSTPNMEMKRSKDNETESHSQSDDRQEKSPSKSSPSARGSFWCYICDFYFSDESALRSHTLLHTGERPHQCEFCSKSFFRRSELKKHQTRCVPLEKIIYTCDVCSKEFTQKTEFQSHSKAHDDDLEQEEFDKIKSAVVRIVPLNEDMLKNNNIKID